jgi:hypothetical protein
MFSLPSRASAAVVGEYKELDSIMESQFHSVSLVYHQHIEHGLSIYMRSAQLHPIYSLPGFRYLTEVSKATGGYTMGLSAARYIQ